MARLRRLAIAFATAVGFLSLRCASANVTARFEIDLIFPRNETYKPSEIFPIALAVQNYSAIQSLGRDFGFFYSIEPYREGRIPGGVSYDMKYFDEVQDPEGPVILVANTNVSEWIHRKKPDDQYKLAWHVRWYGEDECAKTGLYFTDRIMFSIETPWDVRQSANGTGIGKEADLFELPECPVLGSVVDLPPNAEDLSCPLVLDAKQDGAEGDPCAVKIDDDLASRIMSQAASSATASLLATAVTPFPEPTETNAGVMKSPRLLIPLSFVTLFILEFVI